MNRRRFLKAASGLFLPAAPAIIIPKAMAQVGGLSFPGPGPGHSAGGSTPTLVIGSNVALQNANFVAGTYTFMGLNGGTPFPAGALVVLAYFSNTKTAPPSPVLGNPAGVHLTPTLVRAGGQVLVALYQAVTAASTPDQFQITSTGVETVIGIAAVYLTGVNPTATSTDFSTGVGGGTQSLGTGITIPASGFGIIAAGGNQGVSADTWTTASPSNVTASGGDTYISGVPGSVNFSLAMAHALPGTSKAEVALSSFGTDMAAAAWGP